MSIRDTVMSKEKTTVWIIRDLTPMLILKVSDHYKVLFYDTDNQPWIRVRKVFLVTLPNEEGTRNGLTSIVCWGSIQLL